MVKVSIVVPVYNAGLYFEKRMQSLVSQTLCDIEIILVLDCPTDGTDCIAERYALADNRIVIVRNETNMHIGESRNVGLLAARGKYVAFADHDDYCETNMYEALYKLAEQHDADIAFSDMYLEDNNGKVRVKQYFPSTTDSIKEEMLINLLRGNGFYFSVLNHIYRLDFLMKHQLSFVDTRKISLEDRSFNLCAYHYAKKIAYSSEKYLYHVLYSGSTQHTYRFKCFKPMTGHLENTAAFFEKHPEYSSTYKMDFSVETIQRLYYGFLPEVRYKSIFHAFKELSSIRNKPLIQKSLNNFKENPKNVSFPIRCFFWLLRCFYMPQVKAK